MEEQRDVVRRGTRRSQERGALTTQPHLTTHAQPGFHHFAHALVAEHLSQSPREAVAQHVENLEQHDFVRSTIARFKLAVGACSRQLSHGVGEVGRLGVEDRVGEELVDGRQRCGSDRTRGFGRSNHFEERVQQD